MCLFLATRNTFDLMHIFMFFFIFCFARHQFACHIFTSTPCLDLLVTMLKIYLGVLFILSTTFSLYKLKSMFLNSMQITLVSPQIYIVQ